MQGLLISSLLAAATVFGDAPLIPFVAVTGRPTAADCSRRVDGLAKAGFGGLIVYPRSGLEYEYMGAEWLDTVAAFCQAAERNGLEVWLYDEFNWPSGTCKGRVPQEKSEFRYQEMAFYRDPDGTFRHAVAYGPETWVNPYSFGATKRFIELTHEKYAKRLARWFENKTVRGIFSDEPGSPAKVCLDGPAAVHFRWYDGLDADYRKATGRDLFSDIEAWLATRPATADNADDKSVWEQAFSGGCEPRTSKTEVFGVLAKLWAMRFRDAYYRPIRMWCEEHGIEFVGHCVGEDHAAGAVRFNGDPLEVLPYETMPGIDEILTRTGPANVDWLVFLTGEYAIRRNGRGGMCELFAVGPCDMPAAKIRQTYYLAALHGITKYFLSMDSIDMRGLMQKNCYLGPFNSAQPWFADCSRLLAEDARIAARFARLPQVAPSVVLRYPRTLAAMATYARTPDPDDVVRPLLNALCGAQLSVRLVKEDEPAQGPIILSVEGDGLREERSGTVFTTVDEAIAYVRAHVSPCRRFEERDGRWAEALAVREYADAERSLLAVNLDEYHARDLVMVDRDGTRRPVTIPPRGILTWSDREMNARPAEARPHVLDLGGRWNLSFDRPTLWRVAYGEGCSKAEIFVDERLEGVRLAVRDYPKSVGTVRIDGRVIAADESCTVLPDGFANLYRMSRPFTLEPGRHVLSFDGEDRIYFFPAVFLSGDFAVKDGRFLRRPVCGETGSLDALGLGTFVGKVTYSADLAIPLAGASQIAFTTGGHYAEVRLDGRSLGLRGWDPFSFDVPADLRGRTVRAEISLWTSYRPMFGAYDVPNAWWRGRVTDYGPVDNLVSTPGYFCGLKPLSGGEREAGGADDLQAAVDRAAASPEKRLVLERGQVFRLTRPLKLDVRHAGITIEGNGAVLDGGMRVTGWRQDGRLIKATVDGWDGDILSLWVNGRRARLAQTPNGDGARHVALAGTGSTNAMVVSAADISPVLLASAEERADALVDYIWAWYSPRFRLKGVRDIGNGKAELSWHSFPSRSTGSRMDQPTNPFEPAPFACEWAGDAHYAILNMKCLLDDPGEFYFDRRNRELSYMPRPGEALETIEAYYPRLERILEIGGVLPEEKVCDVTIRGLELRHGLQRRTANDGLDFRPSAQGAAENAGFVLVSFASRIRFEDVTVRNCDLYGLDLHYNVWDSSVVNCTFEDCGSGGVRIGSDYEISNNVTCDWRRNPLVSGGNLVSNCLVKSFGRWNRSGVGILVCDACSNTVARNEISDGFYTGINVGWMWNTQKVHSVCNRIANNRICRLGQGILDDLAGIYVLGRDSKSEIVGNVISDIRRGHYGAWGLYFDSRAGDYRAERNWCYATDDGGFFKNQGWDIRVVGNRFEDCTTSQLGEESLYSPDSLLFASNYVTWASPATCCRGHELRPQFCKVFDNYFKNTKESPVSEAAAVKAGYRPFKVDAGRASCGLNAAKSYPLMDAVWSASVAGGGVVSLADGEYHFYSSSATNMRFHVSNHDQPDVRPVFLPFIGVTNVAVVAKNAKFIMHGMGTAILVRDSLGVSFKGITIEWEKPFFAKAEIVGFEDGKTRVRFPARDKVVVEDGKLMLCGEDWKVNLRDGNVFDRVTHEMIERTADVIFSGRGWACEKGDFLIDVDLSRIGAGAKVGDVYVMRNGYRPHPIVCLDHAKDTVFEDFVFRDGFGMGILAQLSENVTLRGGGCYPRDRDEYNSNTIDATHFSNCRGTMTVENCRFEGMMDDALNVHSTSMGIVAKPSANSIRCRYMHPQAIGFGVFAPGDAIRFIAGKTLENGFVGKVKSVETHDEREITLTLEEDFPSEYGVGDAVENADWQCAVVFRNNTIANNRARGVLFTTPHRIVCEGNFFDHVSGSAILFAGDAQGWYESGACEDVLIRKNRFRDCLTSVFQYCDGLVSIHPEVKDLKGQKRRYHRNIVIEDNDIETFDIPLLYALSAEDVVWRNNRVTKHNRYRGWEKPELIKIGCGRVEWE